MESITDYGLIQPLDSSLFNKIRSMVNRLPSWVFISLALILMGLALFPILRFALGIDSQIQIQFLTAVMMLISGVMCGLTGMILLVRRLPDINWDKRSDDGELQTSELQSREDHNTEHQNNRSLVAIHATGLLIFTGIPLANFLVCYAVWLRTRHISGQHDTHGREAICQQISLYLYAMLCLFMALLIVGVFGLLLLLTAHLTFCLLACLQAHSGKLFRYPANIAIIDRKISSTGAESTAR